MTRGIGLYRHSLGSHTPPPAPTFVAETLFCNPSAQTSITGNRPAGISSGDWLIAFLTILDFSTGTVPSGWTNIPGASGWVGGGGRVNIWAYYKIAGASEPSTFTWGLSGTCWAGLTIAAYRGVNSLGPLGTPGVTNNSPALAPSVTTTSANSLVTCSWAAGALNAGVVISAPTPSGVSDWQTATGSGFVSVAVGDFVQPSPGATTIFSCSYSPGPGGEQSAGVQMALAP